MSLNRTLALTACMTALSLGACATSAPHDEARPVAITPTEQYPLAIAEQPDELLLAPHDFGLSAAQHAALIDFGLRWRDKSTTEVVIEASTAGGADAYNTSRATADLLTSQGVPVRIIGYDAAPGAPIRVSFLVPEAEVPDCNRSWERLTATHSNQPYANFGCAVTANRAAMIANAGDIARPRSDGPVDAERRQVVLDKYRLGQVTSSPKDNQASVSVSKAVN